MLIGSIDPVNPTRRAGIDPTDAILHHRTDIIAGQTVDDGQARDAGAIGGRGRCPQEAAARCRTPHRSVPAHQQVADSAYRSEFPLGEMNGRTTPQARESAVIVEPHPDAARTILGKRGHKIAIEVGKALNRVIVMQDVGRSFPAREAVGLSLADRGDPHIAARILEQPEDDVGCQAVDARESTLLTRTMQVGGAVDALQSQSA